MYDQVLDNFRKAAESTMQIQQEMFRSWAQQWTQPPMVPGMPGAANPAEGAAEQVRAFQKRWAEAVTDTIRKHKETLDAQYKAGVRTIEDAFRVGEAKDPEQFRRLVEDLWRQSFDCLKTIVEAQMQDFQASLDRWLEAAGVKK
jgi:hypothetical protein